MEVLKWARYFDFEAMFCLVIGGVLIAKAISFYLKRTNIFSKGITVKGEVVDFKLRFSSNILSSVPIIRFKTEEGRIIESEYTTSAFGIHFELGMEVTIIYSKDRPTSFFLKEEGGRGNILPVILLVIACMMIVIAIRRVFSI
ncbi:DUF3592 domain-containing protein [Chitinophaga sp. SYP-B3965]|uniref:DUF3592 domain-containing protein n=1 Tax=Chitinophaga sp. SYP-B3965 TaxID=2663120 RepID=UPI0015646366|nr:DUF3592 domain-containing protein [Chitinophaga sp. SYP-B3965]